MCDITVLARGLILEDSVSYQGLRLDLWYGVWLVKPKNPSLNGCALRNVQAHTQLQYMC